MKLIVAITGASGAVLGKRLVEVLKSGKNKDKYEIHLIVSEKAKEIAAYEETDLKKTIGLANYSYDEDDLESAISSSSHGVDAMVVIPCSMKTLSAMASGLCDNLVNRAAENVLKLGRRLVVVPRDTPLSLAALENMAKLKKDGAIIVPPVMAYYYKPKTIDDVTDFFVGKVLDCLEIEHDLYEKWSGEK
jgi:4-hydroxy-3-polyprenylbenzoate decarboxylase